MTIEENESDRAAREVEGRGMFGGFITKDSGEREEFDSGMMRDTESGKPRFDLTMPEGVPYEDQMLTRFAMLMSRGADKYAARNWEAANSEAEIKRAKSSAFRHFMQWYCGERDEDHAAAVMFGIMVVETTERKLRVIEEAEVHETAINIFFDPVALQPCNTEEIADALQRSFDRRKHAGGYTPPTLTM